MDRKNGHTRTIPPMFRNMPEVWERMAPRYDQMVKDGAELMDRIGEEGKRAQEARDRMRGGA